VRPANLTPTSRAADVLDELLDTLKFTSARGAPSEPPEGCFDVFGEGPRPVIFFSAAAGGLRSFEQPLDLQLRHTPVQPASSRSSVADCGAAAGLGDRPSASRNLQGVVDDGHVVHCGA